MTADSLPERIRDFLNHDLSPEIVRHWLEHHGLVSVPVADAEMLKRCRGAVTVPILGWTMHADGSVTQMRLYTAPPGGGALDPTAADEQRYGDFEQFLIDKLGPSALTGEKTSIYDAAKLAWDAGRGSAQSTADKLAEALRECHDALLSAHNAISFNGGLGLSSLWEKCNKADGNSRTALAEYDAQRG